MNRSTIFRGVRLTAVALLTLSLVGFAWVWFAPCWLGGCAPLDELAEYQAEGSQLLDIHGEPFGTLATVNRRIVPIDSLPPHVPRAFVAVEDQRFYDHGGIDFRRLGGAMLSNVRKGGVAEGGSTITQQLARNLFPEWLPYQERSVRRKVMEARVARQIERSFTKEKILELYLNHIYLGEGAYGIEAAANTYFGKPASELSVVEAALLGGLPKAPSQINPVADRERAMERRNLVLHEMAEVGYITEAEAAEASAEPIRLAKARQGNEGVQGSYFIERVRREMEEAVGSRFYTAGLKVYTTLDLGAQRAAEEELARQLDAVEAGRFGAYRHDTYPETKGVSDETGVTPYLQGAVVLMDAGTGEVRALVGGRDFEDSKYDRAVQALRQPGSAFKPFVYLTALERYGSPLHTVEDAPVRVVLSGGRIWEPKNYTGQYDGQLTLREALTRSKNTVTVRLAQEIGMEPAIDAARVLGISNEISATPATALGAAEVHPIELVSAYAAFANGGYRVRPHFIQRVEDRHGRVVWQARQERDQVLDPAVAFVLTSMLQDVVTRGTGTPARAGGYRGPAAGKTGTTNAATDIWFIGYTPELVGGVWMGLDKPKTIVRGASGGTIAAPVWGRIMGRVYSGRAAPKAWTPPPGVQTAQVELGTGMVVNDLCPARGPVYTEYFVGAAPPRQACYPTATYTGTTLADTLWIDEERVDGTMPDTLGNTVAPGIDWPELQELRRRMTVGETTAGGQRGGAVVPPAGSAADTRAQPRTDTVAPPRARTEAGEPKLLGTPVRRDTSSAPPPDTTSAPPPGEATDAGGTGAAADTADGSNGESRGGSTDASAPLRGTNRADRSYP